MDDLTTPRSRGQAQIILAVSPADGLVAVPVGEQYPWANTALQLTPGFERRPDGTYALRDVDTAAPILRALADTARRHRVHLFGGPRTYLGDYATALADGLPGQWTVKVEVYAHPVWQEDLVPLLWDAGELIDCVEHIRIPYAAQLTNGAGIELLLAERPGSTDEYLLGSFASATFDDNYADPHAPASIVLSSDAAHAAGLVTGTFLPAYEQAVHERLLAAVEAAHGRLEQLHATWTAIQHSGRYSDGTRLDPATLGHTQQQYLEEGSVEWRRMRPHAAALLSRVRPVAGAEDSASLDRLHQLLHPDVAEPSWPAAPSSPPALQPGTAEILRRWRTGARRPYCARHTPLAPSARLPRSGPRFPLPAQPRPPSPVIGSGERPAADDLPRPSGRPMQPHFHFGLHAEHGVVARPSTAITSHLAAWFLEREQFEPVPGKSDLFRLTQPDHDLRRRARQTVHDLRRRGFTVQADLSLDPAETAPPNAPTQGNAAAERLARIARAAAARPPQHRVNAPQVASVPVPALGTHSSAARRTL